MFALQDLWTAQPACLSFKRGQFISLVCPCLQCLIANDMSLYYCTYSSRLRNDYFMSLPKRIVLPKLVDPVESFPFDTRLPSFPIPKFLTLFLEGTIFDSMLCPMVL